MIWYDLLEESQCQEQQFDRAKRALRWLETPSPWSRVSAEDLWEALYTSVLSQL